MHETDTSKQARNLQSFSTFPVGFKAQGFSFACSHTISPVVLELDQKNWLFPVEQFFLLTTFTNDCLHAMVSPYSGNPISTYSTYLKY